MAQAPARPWRSGRNSAGRPRAVLGRAQKRLTQRAGVSRSTVRDFEGECHALHRASKAQIVRALESSGVWLRKTSGAG